jgi:hypothetical protein
MLTVNEKVWALIDDDHYPATIVGSGLVHNKYGQIEAYALITFENIPYQFARVDIGTNEADQEIFVAHPDNLVQMTEQEKTFPNYYVPFKLEG